MLPRLQVLRPQWQLLECLCRDAGRKCHYVESGLGVRDTLLLLTSSTRLKNVAAFVNTATQIRQVILQDVNSQVAVYTYSPEEVREAPLVTLGNVVDIAAYFSEYDSMCHVILATTDGNIHEVISNKPG